MSSRPEPLSDILRIRKRPGMYVGPIDDGTGLHNLVLGQVTSAIADVISGRTRRIEVDVRAEGVFAVHSIGPGFSPWSDPHAISVERREAAIELCSRYYSRQADVEGGALPCLCTLNALSTWMRDEVWGAGVIYGFSYRDGHLESVITETIGAEHPKRGEAGLSTSFQPNEIIFSGARFDLDRLAVMLGEVSRRNGGISILVNDER